MARTRSKKLITLNQNILVEFRGGEAWALDTKTQNVLHLSGSAVKVLKALSMAPSAGISLDRLRQELPGEKRATVLSILSELYASHLIEGFNPSADRAPSMPASLILGAFSLGAGVFLSPAPAHGLNCIGPPSCTGLGGVCTVAEGPPGQFYCKKGGASIGFCGPTCT